MSPLWARRAPTHRLTLDGGRRRKHRAAQPVTHAGVFRTVTLHALVLVGLG